MQPVITSAVLAQLQADVARQKQDQNAEREPKNILKIALVTETWPPKFNGVALSMMQLTIGLQARGHQFLLVRIEQPEIETQFKPEQYCILKSQSLPKYQQGQFGWPQVFKLAQALDQFKPNIMHIMSEGPLGLLALNQAKKSNIAISSGFYSAFQNFSRYFDLAFLLPPVRRYLKWFHNQTDLTCVPNQDAIRTLNALGVYCAMHTVGYGVDSEKFHPHYRDNTLRKIWHADQDTTVLLYAGQMPTDLDQPHVLDAYQQLQLAQPNRVFKLVILAEIPNAKEQRYRHPDIIFMGEQNGTFLAQCYASADVCVCANLLKNQTQSVLEAMASAIPILAFDNDAHLHQMIEPKNGWLIPMSQVQKWIQQMQQLPSLTILKQMGEQARNKAVKDSWHQPILALEKALLRCAFG